MRVKRVRCFWHIGVMPIPVSYQDHGDGGGGDDDDNGGDDDNDVGITMVAIIFMTEKSNVFSN